MRESMEIYPRTAAERAMKLQEVLLRATSGKIKWWQAAELIGISERQMRRWRKRLRGARPPGVVGPATAEAKQQASAEGAGGRGSEPCTGTSTSI
jgi:hypothetical protein